MPQSWLTNAITEGLKTYIDAASDRIVRFSPPRDWPILPALEGLTSRVETRFLLQRPFRDLRSDVVALTTDPGECTAWRNDGERDFSVVVLGYTEGTLDAGLKDLQTVDIASIVSLWKANATNELALLSDDLAKPEFHDLLDELFHLTTISRISATQLTDYFASLKSDPSVRKVQSQLWRLGYCADAHVLDTGVSRSRLKRNSDLVETLEVGDSTAVQRLRTAAGRHRPENPEDQTVAQAALEYIETGDNSRLADVELEALERVLRGRSDPPPPPPPSAKAVSIFDLLNMYSQYPDDVRNWIVDTRQAPLEMHGRTHAEISIAGAPYSLELGGAFKTGHEVVEHDEDHRSDEASMMLHAAANPVIAAEHDGGPPPKSLEDANGKKVTLSDLLERQLDLDGLDDYLAARQTVDPLTWIDSLEDLFTRLILDAQVLDYAISYCELAVRILQKACGSQSGRPTLLMAQALETVRDSGHDSGWIALSRVHPYVLDPIAQLAEFCTKALETGNVPPRLGDAANWMLDRAIPAYPTIHRDRDTYHLVSRSPTVLYERRSEQAQPSLNESRGLARILLAVLKYAPWLRDGMSVLVIDPPRGTGLSRALSELRSQLADSATLTIFHLRTRPETSDGLSGFDGDVVYLPEETATRHDRSLPRVDVVLAFGSEPETTHAVAAETWSAARGMHLALRLSVSATDDIFDSHQQPRIDLDPNRNNGVVVAMHEIYSRLTGGRAPHAVLSPPSRAGAQVLWRNAANASEWLIVARPGPFGLMDAGTDIPSARLVGRATAGRYLLSVYSTDEMYAVRRSFERFLRHTPVAHIPPSEIAERLVEHASRSSRSLLYAAHSPGPSIGELIGLDLAAMTDTEFRQSVSLAMDDLSWTRAWLNEPLRPDFLVFQFAPDSGRVRVRVLECKSDQSSEAVPLTPGSPVIAEALRQVSAASSLVQSLFGDTTTLAEDLQHSSLMEHLMAVLLSSKSVATSTEAQKVFDLTNALAARSLSPEIENWISLSQPSINGSTCSVTAVGVNIVWSGAPEVQRLLRLESADEGVAAPTSAREDSESAHLPGSGARSGRAPGRGRPYPEPGSPTTGEAVRTPQIASQPESATARLADSIVLACRIHGLSVADNRPKYVIEGPTLVAVGIQLEEGATLQPLRSRMADIARDVGLGDRAHEITFENTGEPRVVQILVPRPDRKFPKLPKDRLGILHPDGYLPVYLGQTITGEDYVSSVERWPHMLIAGTTGSGKTTFLVNLLSQLNRFESNCLSLAIADGKGDTDYIGLVHQDKFCRRFPDVQLGPDNALELVRWVVDELEVRQDAIHRIARASTARRNLKAVDIYREAVRQGDRPEISPLVVVVDEFAEIMLAAKKAADEFVDAVQRIAQVGRSRLVHLLLATQRPDRSTIRGAVKANLDARIVMRLPTTADSLTVLGMGGAERLLPKGDMLFRVGTGHAVRLQAYDPE